MILTRVTAVDYDDGDDGHPIVLLAGRDSEGRRVTREVHGAEPYFYVREEAPVPDRMRKHLVEEDHGYESYDGVSLKKLTVKLPKHVREYKADFMDHWEADIPFYRRCSIDYGLSGYVRVPEGPSCHIDEIDTDVDIEDVTPIRPRLVIADIEVLQEGPPLSIDELLNWGDERISHITLWDSYEDDYTLLCLDPDHEVSGSEVKMHLDDHIGDNEVATELDRNMSLQKYQDEEALLEGFLRYFESRRPDIISGWNFVSFDWEYILKRLDQFDDLSAHRLSDIGYVNGYTTASRVDCVPAFDMMEAYTGPKMSYTRWRSKALDYVSKVVFGVGKLPNINVTQTFKDDPNRLAAYNILDVLLCVALDRQEAIHEFFLELAELSQIQIYDTQYEMRLVDGYIMSRGGDDEILPSQREKDIPENAGGLVLNPSDGIQEMVGVFDVKSLYPSSIITWNISPETVIWDKDTTSGPPRTPGGVMSIPWLPDADHADGGDFTSDDIDFDVMYTDMSEEGIIPKHLKGLFPERDARKAKRNQYSPDDYMYDVYDRQQAAVKVIMNAFYGVMSSDYWRLGMYGLGDAVTSVSRYVLWMGKEIAIKHDYDVIYGDTDSIMVSLGDAESDTEEVLSVGRQLEHVLNTEIGMCVVNSGLSETGVHPLLSGDLHGTDLHCIQWEFEKLYERFFQAGTKKRYAGLMIWKEGKHIDGEVDLTGFESRRSDVAELTSEMQPEIIERILSGADFDDISGYIRERIDSIEDQTIDISLIGIPASLKRDLDTYGNTETARACRHSNDVLGYDWGRGDNPWKYFISETPPMAPGTDVVALEWSDDLPDGYELDVDRILERVIEGPIEPIINEAGMKFKELTLGAETNDVSADDWATGDWEESDNGGDDDVFGW